MRSIDIYTERKREREKECKAFLSSRAFQKSFSCSDEWREVRNAFLPFLSVCLRANNKRQNFFVSSVVFVRSRFLREVSQRGWCFGQNTGSKKSFRERERERKSAKESAHRKKDRQTQKDGERRRKTESRILGGEDDIVRDDDDSDDERISSSPPGKISREEEEEEMEQKERANDGGARHGRENPVRGEKHVHHPARRKRCETGGN